MGDKLPDSARRSRMVPWAVAFCLWIALIWAHSLVPGAQSTVESDAAASALDGLFALLGITDSQTMTLIVRKGAHLLEYAVLGFLGRGLLFARLEERGRPMLPAGCLLVLVPIIDECIQLLVPGRSGRLVDVLIDSAGLCLGVLMGWLASRMRRS